MDNFAAVMKGFLRISLQVTPYRLRTAALLGCLAIACALHTQPLEDGSGMAEALQKSESGDTIPTDSSESAFSPVTRPWPESLGQRLEVLLQDGMFRTSMVAIMVYDLDADSAIFAHNERQTLRPASCAKVVTAVTAIDRLGGSHQFKTGLYYTGSIDGGSLNGDLYCVGGFDPLFNSDDMTAFAESVHRMGIDTVRGSVYADKGMKGAATLGEGWCWDDDNPVLSPLLVGRKDDFAAKLVKRLREAGVAVMGVAGEKAKPQGAFSITSRYHTIDQVLTPMMRKSDNLCAEAMFYNIAAAAGTPATEKDARKEVSRIVSKIGLQPNRYRFADGSGLSLYNYASAELLTLLLRYAWRNDNIYHHLAPSLPVAGESGTLSGRMKGVHTKGNVRAKTGTLEGVSSLAGYCTAANGHRLCFAIINQGIMHTQSGRRFQDLVCQAMCSPQ